MNSENCKQTHSPQPTDVYRSVGRLYAAKQGMMACNDNMHNPHKITRGLCIVACHHLRISASDGFFSPIFVVPKKDSGWHPVANLRALNQFVYTSHFKMESIVSLKDIILSGDQTGHLDLKDAYLSILIAKAHWK